MLALASCYWKGIPSVSSHLQSPSVISSVSLLTSPNLCFCLQKSLKQEITRNPNASRWRETENNAQSTGTHTQT